MDKAKMLQNLHTHTQFCDGENTAEQMVEQAIKLGFKSIGFSSHGCVGKFSRYSLKQEDVIPYREEIKRLKKKYAGVIDVFLGLEFDYYTLDSVENYEYSIGSVHYYKPQPDVVYSLDIKDAESLQKTIDEVFEKAKSL